MMVNPVKSEAVGTDGQERLRKAGTVCAVILVLVLTALELLVSDYALSEVQRSTLTVLCAVCGCSMLYCFTVGELTKNYSQMDKLWSVLPVVYTWIIAARGGFRPRLLLFALITTAWGVRLTINFARKGAYRLKFWTGREDYRWSIVRANPVFSRPILWTLFDLLFISVYQNALVLAICLPALACMDSAAPLNAADAAAAVCAVLFLILETVSDELQWHFHRTKQELMSGGKALDELPAPYNLGFNTFGVWSRIRHPNYLGEQGIWLSLSLFTAGAGAARYGIFHWSSVGAFLLVLLFIGSSALGETISSGKYPAYRDYIRQVYKYLPLRKFRPEEQSR